MTPEQIDRMRRIIRLASRLSVEERAEYLDAMTGGEDELRGMIERYFATDMSLERTLRQVPREAPRP